MDDASRFRFCPKIFSGVLIAAFVLASPASAASEIPENILRISILDRQPSFNVGAEKRIALFDLNAGKKAELAGRTIYLVKPREEGIALDGSPFGVLVRLMPEEGDFLRVNGRRYRGTLLIRYANKNEMTVINELGIDEYIGGILPREVSPSWPIEALKAQSVISRSFALKNIGRHGSAGYDLCSTVHCQVYGGMEGEHLRTNQAVNDTVNEVVLYKEDLANTVFFSNCGGKTEYPANAWEGSAKIPYLKSVRCGYCKGSNHREWKEFVSMEKLESAFAQTSVEFPIQSISVSDRVKSGRAASIKIKGGRGSQKLRAGHFRMALGPDLIRSTWITRIRKKGNGFLFQGKGWGHGVGLCQEGAKGMAERGKSYKKIVRFYYTGADVIRVDD